MDLLPHLSFDTEGAALGEGSIEVPARIAERFPCVRERKLRLLLPRDPRLQAGYFGIAGEQIAPGISDAARSFGIHVERTVAAFLRENLNDLSGEALSLRVEGRAGRPPAWFSAKHGSSASYPDLAQDILEISVTIEPHEAGRLVTLNA